MKNFAMSQIGLKIGVVGGDVNDIPCAVRSLCGRRQREGSTFACQLIPDAAACLSPSILLPPPIPFSRVEDFAREVVVVSFAAFPYGNWGHATDRESPQYWMVFL